MAEPFQLKTSSHLVEVTGLRAWNMRQLGETIGMAPDESIFYHTYQSFREHHFVTEPYASDFAQWAEASLHFPLLAEELGVLDLRDFTSLEELRMQLMRIVMNILDENPAWARRPADYPFDFSRSHSVINELGLEANTPEELARILPQVSIRCLYYHLIEARLRLGLKDNDFSYWLRKQWQDNHKVVKAADAIEELDIYHYTLPALRDRIISLLREVGV
jgi:hypothetical protein